MNRNHRTTIGELIAEPTTEDEEKPSKSALKRHAHALQGLGERLVELKPGKLKKLPLSDDMRAAIAIAQRIPLGAREGRRRQLQLIGKLMRTEQVTEIAAVLDAEKTQTKAQSHRLQTATRWRDRLLSGDATWAELMGRYEGAASFEGLYRDALSERTAGHPPKAQRLLYRAILELIPE